MDSGVSVRRPTWGHRHDMSILWIIAVIIAIAGIVAIFRGSILAGIVLLIVACAVGPGGWSVFHDRGNNKAGLAPSATAGLR